MPKTKLGKSNEFNNPGMKVQTQESFQKVIFKKIQKQAHPEWNFLQTLI